MRLIEAGEDRLGPTYTKAAYALFPRYRLDQAVEIEVERLRTEDLGSVERAQALILEAGDSAFSLLREEFKDKSEALTALADECKAFKDYLVSLDPTEIAGTDPLPYRRVLSKSESDRLRGELKTLWGVSGYWYPLAKCSSDLSVIAFHEELWERRDGKSQLLRALQERAVERCFLFLQGPVDYEIERSLVDARYAGDESFITSDFEWLVYSSHESSISVAGWLADFFRNQWSDWESVAYGGPFHTADLRGTWEWKK